MESYCLKGVGFQFAMTRMFWMWIVVMDIRNSMYILIHRKMVELVNFFLRIFYHTQTFPEHCRLYLYICLKQEEGSHGHSKQSWGKRRGPTCPWLAVRVPLVSRAILAPRRRDWPGPGVALSQMIG